LVIFVFVHLIIKRSAQITCGHVHDHVKFIEYVLHRQSILKCLFHVNEVTEISVSLFIIILITDFIIKCSNASFNLLQSCVHSSFKVNQRESIIKDVLEIIYQYI